MKKLFASTPILLFLILSLSGCNTVGAKKCKSDDHLRSCRCAVFAASDWLLPVGTQK